MNQIELNKGWCLFYFGFQEQEQRGADLDKVIFGGSISGRETWERGESFVVSGVIEAVFFFIIFYATVVIAVMRACWYHHFLPFAHLQYYSLWLLLYKNVKQDFTAFCLRSPISFFPPLPRTLMLKLPPSLIRILGTVGQTFNF